MRVSGLLACLFTAAYIAASGASYDGGWKAPKNNLIGSNFPSGWKDSGQGQTRLLYKDWNLVHGTDYVPRRQGNSPSCVGQAVAAAVDFLSATQIRKGNPERAPPAQAAACVIYGLSRVEIGEAKSSFGGSHNLWACQAIKEYGVVARLNYPLLGQDLRTPSPARAIKFGYEGVPLGLEKIARIHPVKEYISISSYESLRDAIYHGCPVVIGSKQGFGKGKRTRDSDGFLVPPKRLFFKSTWKHSQVCIGVCDSGRKGALLLNSWGSQWVKGPKRFGDEPEGSYWADAKIINKMVGHGDSFAIRGFQGYSNYKLWKP